MDEGLARNIGVSNFFEEHLDEVLAIARIKVSTCLCKTGTSAHVFVVRG